MWERSLTDTRHSGLASVDGGADRQPRTKKKKRHINGHMKTRKNSTCCGARTAEARRRRPPSVSKSLKVIITSLIKPTKWRTKGREEWRERD